MSDRPGSKATMGGMASESLVNRDKRERLKQLAMEVIDLAKDPYFLPNHLGTFECKLCLTLHTNEGSYLTHTQGKRHQKNLACRAAKEARDHNTVTVGPLRPQIDIKQYVKIGRPGYKVTKQRDPLNGQQSLLFQIDYPEISDGIIPRHRFMSAYEQHVEAPDKNWQYLLFAAEPYEIISFKIPSREIDKGISNHHQSNENGNMNENNNSKFWTHWNSDSKQFYLQLSFKLQNDLQPSSLGVIINANAFGDGRRNQMNDTTRFLSNFHSNRPHNLSMMNNHNSGLTSLGDIKLQLT
ncbi:hypothetical protein SNEBB_001090 [Seison nebaliae]|nr:hypothetical protein SNEBB_001090 [Seison nebaliae]